MRKNILKYNIEEYIPQREPVIMVDGLSEAGENYAISFFEIKDDNIFVQDGVFSETGIIEHMAQTAALSSGYKAKQQGEEIKTGFIGSIKNFTLYKQVKVSDLLVSKLEQLAEVMNASIVQVKTYINNELIAEVEFKIFLLP